MSVMTTTSTTQPAGLPRGRASTRAFDLLLKKDRLQRAGCAHYWVVDPDVPAIRTWQLVDGVYVDSGVASSDETLTLTAPFAVEIRPLALLT